MAKQKEQASETDRVFLKLMGTAVRLFERTAPDSEARAEDYMVASVLAAVCEWHYPTLPQTPLTPEARKLAEKIKKELRETRV